MDTHTHTSGHRSDTVCSSTLVQMGSLSKSGPLPFLLLTPDLSDIAAIPHQGKIITTITHFCIMFLRMTKSDVRTSTAFSWSVKTLKKKSIFMHSCQSQSRNIATNQQVAYPAYIKFDSGGIAAMKTCRRPESYTNSNAHENYCIHKNKQAHGSKKTYEYV